MRVLLFTGKGGVGKTTVAAATAVRLANRGLSTLVMSTDAAHSLVDVLGLPGRVSTHGEPVEVSSRLHVHQIDTLQRFEESWSTIRRYLLTVLDSAGIDRVHAEELTVLPGADEILALLEVRRLATSGPWEVLVVDCAPTAETLRLLALPGALNWYVERVLPAERMLVKALRPVLTKAVGVPMPGDSVFDALEILHRELADAHEVLTGPGTSIRLVLTPEQIVVAEARRLLTSLSLYGYRVDGVVANRMFPDDDADRWRSAWAAAQRGVLLEAEESFAPLPVWRSSYREREPVGVAELADLARELYGDADPLHTTHTQPALELGEVNGETRLSLPLPFAGTADVDVARCDDELVVTVGSHRRLLSLPATLRGRAVNGAHLDRGRLTIRFEAAPDRVLADGLSR